MPPPRLHPEPPISAEADPIALFEGEDVDRGGSWAPPTLDDLDKIQPSFNLASDTT